MTTTKPRFITGHARLRDGREAYIFEVSTDIFIKYKCTDEWIASSRDLNGAVSENYESKLDLMPNALPQKHIIEPVCFVKKDNVYALVYDGANSPLNDLLLHSKWRVTLEELE